MAVLLMGRFAPLAVLVLAINVIVHYLRRVCPTLCEEGAIYSPQVIQYPVFLCTNRRLEN
jgi:hypothetical protein